ncbi:MAG TPA: hypothetical protein PLF81_19955 [Candidatus Anammoximicrobium sp.]|nr:hypothetical protein [Candidatus Anammoximicrobium sp.]
MSIWAVYHTCFRLLDPSGELCLTENLEIHIIELPKFRKALAELDRWEIRKAMEVLKMLAQSDMERELYEGRLKAKRDMQTLETERRIAEDSGGPAEDSGGALADGGRAACRLAAALRGGRPRTRGGQEDAGPADPILRTPAGKASVEC